MDNPFPEIQHFCQSCGTPDEMLTNYHLRAADIVGKVHAALKRK